MRAAAVSALLRLSSAAARPRAHAQFRSAPTARVLPCTRRFACAARPPPPPRLHMVFTCGKCETHATKSFTKNAYEKGVVLVTCPGCQARHVIADNLGWFGEEKNVEEILAKKGQKVTTITDSDIDYAP